MVRGNGVAIEGLTLQPLPEARLHEVRALHALSFEALAAAVHSREQIAAHVKYMRAVAYADELRACRMMMALLPDGALVATAGWNPVEDAPGTARVRKVFVRPDLARRGLGRRMVLDAEVRARAAGLGRLIVRANVNAAPLYHSLGYREERSGTMPVADGVELPVIIMSKDVTLSSGA